MKDKFVAALAKIGQRFMDKRFFIFDLNVEHADPNAAVIGGRILEEADLKLVTERLTAMFPGCQIDTHRVHMLRSLNNPVLAVGTNLTGLYAEKSFHSELLSQVFYGEKFEILEEDNRWAFVRQSDGYLGFTYLPYLTGKIIPPPTHLVTVPASMVYSAPDPTSPVLTRVLGGTVVHFQTSQGDWSNIAANRCGWLRSSDLRPLKRTFPVEADRREQMVRDALRLTGIPYLWGGVSANGIDCSGFVRLVYRWSGINLPRDADLQYQTGKPVSPPFRPGDLLFFGDPGGKKRIDHVGMSLGGWEIIHSSLARNGVYADHIQAVESLRENLVGGCTFIED